MFFLWPVAELLALSLFDSRGSLSAANYERIVNTPLYVRVLTVTLRISAITACVSVLLGFPLAYWMSRMNPQARTYVLLFVLIPFWTSYLVKTFAWMLVLGRTGVINQIFGVVGAQPLSMLQGEGAVIVGMVHGMLPLAVLTMLPVISSVDNRLLQAAQTLGAHPVRGFWLTYVPLSLPGLTSAGLLTFVTSLGFFIVPALLGGPQQTFLAQMIISQIQQLLNFGFASTLSVLLLVATFIAWFIYDRLFGMSSLSGGQAVPKTRGGLIRSSGRLILRVCADICELVSKAAATLLPARVRKQTMPAYGILVLFFLAAPTLVVIPIAFTNSSFLDFPPTGYSLRWFEVYFQSPLWMTATLNSFVIGFASALLATAIGGLAALGVAKSDMRWKGAVFALMLSPMIVPRIVFGVGLMYLFARMGLIGTRMGLIVGHVVLALPFTFVTIAAVLKNHDWRLDQAASTLGANRLRVLTRITIPLTKGALIAAFLFAFITSFDELTLAIFVSGGVMTTLPKQMWDDMFLQLNPTIAAASVIVFVLALTLLLLAEKLSKQAR
ncbi:ABC transporter permease subunit [Bosea sp. (in: a-proteobacteria)]|uniref:ABC transporter permease subunit n=1 Tax=Bosea sp. (in: a-proteobacteria) TaxID=1871050 RepID=UPI00334152B5